MKIFLIIIALTLLGGCGPELPEGYGWVSVGLKSKNAMVLPSINPGERLDVRRWLGLPSVLSTDPYVCELSQVTNDLGVYIPEDNDITEYGNIPFTFDTVAADAAASGAFLDQFTATTFPVRTGTGRYLVYAGLYYSGTCSNPYSIVSDFQSGLAVPMYGQSSTFDVTEGGSIAYTLGVTVSEDHFITTSGGPANANSIFSYIEVYGGSQSHCPQRVTLDNTVKVFDERSGQWFSFPTLEKVTDNHPVYVGPLIPRRFYTVNLKCNAEAGIVGRDESQASILTFPGTTTTISFPN